VLHRPLAVAQNRLGSEGLAKQGLALPQRSHKPGLTSLFFLKGFISH